MTYTYGEDEQRIKSVFTSLGGLAETKVYLGAYEVRSKLKIWDQIIYVNAGNGLCAIIVKTLFNKVTPYFVYTDHLGSLLTLTDPGGTVVAEQNFDAWGRNRNPVNWSYSGVPANPTWLYRGFTGHEHVKQFALINMNGRMYDPVTCRMLSPDNFVQLPYYTQSFNRFSYCINNPLVFTDKNGQWFGLDDAIAAGIGFITGYVGHGLSTGNWGWDALAAGGISAGASWLAYNTAGAATAFLTKTGVSAGVSAVLGQGIGGVVGSGVGSASSQLYFNHSIDLSTLGRASLYGFGNGIGTGLFDQSGMLTKHFPMSHAIKYVLRSTAGEIAGGLSLGGDFSNMTFGWNIGLALPVISDIASIATSGPLSKAANNFARKKIEDNREMVGMNYDVDLKTRMDYGAYLPSDAYSTDDYYIYKGNGQYLYSETGVYANVALSGGATINRIGSIKITGLNIPSLSPITFRVPIINLPFTLGQAANFSGIYTNMYRYAKR